MTSSTTPTLDFGDQTALIADLSQFARELKGSAILKVAAEVRAMIASGKPVCNLTVGDFDPKQFPIPATLRQGIERALGQGETNYPPSDGIPALRKAVGDYVEREQGVRYPLESILVASGGRPVVFGAYRVLLDAGDEVLYPVPSWNNDYYTAMMGARAVEVPGLREHGFQPTVDQLAPHLSTARLLCLCTPGNPTGTMIDADSLRAIMEAVVAENEARRSRGRKPLFVLFDQMYGSLAFPPAEHANPLALVPESAPYVVALDGISKAFAATGLRVGWALGPAAVIAKMKDFLGHVGTWAPRPEQVATAAFLSDPGAVADYRARFFPEVQARLDALYQGFQALRKAGYPVDCINPQGAIYLSLQLDLIGRQLGERRITSNDEIRLELLEKAGLAVVPFQAFGLADETGWFRMSVGAVSLQDIHDAFPRVRQLLDQVR